LEPKASIRLALEEEKNNNNNNNRLIMSHVLTLEIPQQNKRSVYLNLLNDDLNGW
jgi:hypothetical protein